MISSSHNFLFVHIPKTAGNSIQMALRSCADDIFTRQGDMQDGVERFGLRNPLYGQLRKHSVLSEYRDVLGEGLFGSMFKFTCVRNPWDRMISMYFSPHHGSPVAWDRGKFIRLVLSARTLDVFIGLNDSRSNLLENVDDVIRFESLASDFRRVAGRLGLPDARLDRLNQGRREDYRGYYDGELASLVADKFRHEIELFDYRF